MHETVLATRDVSSRVSDIEESIPGQFTLKSIFRRSVHSPNSKANEVSEVERFLGDRLVLILIYEPPLTLSISVHGELDFIPPRKDSRSARVFPFLVRFIDRVPR